MTDRQLDITADAALGFWAQSISAKDGEILLDVPEDRVLKISTISLSVESLQQQQQQQQGSKSNFTSLCVVDLNGNENENENVAEESAATATATVTATKKDKTAKQASSIKQVHAEYVVASLSSTTQPSMAVDLHFVPHQNVALKVVGNSTLHVTGYTTFIGNDEDDQDDIDPEYGGYDSRRLPYGATVNGHALSDDDSDDDDYDDDHAILMRAIGGHHDEDDDDEDDDDDVDISESSNVNIRVLGSDEGSQSDGGSDRSGQSSSSSSDEEEESAAAATAPKKRGKQQKGKQTAVTGGVTATKSPITSPQLNGQQKLKRKADDTTANLTSPITDKKSKPTPAIATATATKSKTSAPSTASSSTATATGAGIKVKCTGCDKFFGSEGAMQQHFTSKHKVNA